MGHWHPIVSVDFHEHVMTGMMVLRQVYSLVVLTSDARNHLQGMGHQG